jgi:hypothetical protein
MDSRARLGRRRGVAGFAAIAWLTIAAAGALVVVAVFLPEGISIGGNACGGPTETLPQVCRHIDRELALADLGWFSWAAVAGGLLLVVAGIAGARVPRWRSILGVVALAVVLVGLLGAGHVDNRFCPGGEMVGTCGRTDDEWGPVLRDPLLELRAETRAELVGRLARPGGPAFEEGQTMETFRSRARDGFVLLKEVVVAAVFLLSLVVALRWIRPAAFAVVAAATGALVAVAGVWDYTNSCSEDVGCPEQRGVLTVAAVGVAVIVWVATIVIAAVVSRLRRASR